MLGGLTSILLSNLKMDDGARCMQPSCYTRLTEVSELKNFHKIKFTHTFLVFFEKLNLKNLN